MSKQTAVNVRSLDAAPCTLTDWSSVVVLRNSLVLTSCLIVSYFAGIWSLRASKSGEAARVRGLQRTRGRLWRRSRRCAWSRCKCWSKCPPGCSTGRSRRCWSPRWPGRAAAGSGTSLRPPHLQVRQTVRCRCRTHHHVSLFYVTLLDAVLRLTEANFTLGALFGVADARRRQTIQRCPSPLQNGDQAIRGGALQEESEVFGLFMWCVFWQQAGNRNVKTFVSIDYQAAVTLNRQQRSALRLIPSPEGNLLTWS